MNNKVSKSGISLGTIIFLIFLVLKLTGVGIVATWSWLWVTSPLWIPIAIIGIIGIIFFITVLLIAAGQKRN